MSARKAKGERRAFAYIRVSITDQADHGVNLEAQESRVRDWCAANGYVRIEVFMDRDLSGARADTRPALQEALAATRRGDALVVFSLSRLARSTGDILEIANALERRGADRVSLSEKIDTTSAAGRMAFVLRLNLAEIERIKTRPLPAEELAVIKDSIVEAFPSTRTPPEPARAIARSAAPSCAI